jgi:hypothetical protein
VSAPRRYDAQTMAPPVTNVAGPRLAERGESKLQARWAVGALLEPCRTRRPARLHSWPGARRWVIRSAAQPIEQGAGVPAVDGS